jgi:tungstate transport system permease protein
MIAELAGIIWISIRVSGIAALIASVLAVPLALLISSRSFAGKKLILLLNQTLMAAPTVVIGLLLYFMLSRNGVLGRFALLFTPAAMVIGQVILILPIIFGFSYSALRQVDKKARLTALSLGASSVQAGWIVIKEAKFPLVVAVLAGFARAISEVGVAMMLGGNIRHYTRTMTTAIALESSKGEFANGVILGVLLLIITLGINLVVNNGLGAKE